MEWKKISILKKNKGGNAFILFFPFETTFIKVIYESRPKNFTTIVSQCQEQKYKKLHKMRCPELYNIPIDKIITLCYTTIRKNKEGSPMKLDNYIRVHLYSDKTGFTVECYRVPVWLLDSGVCKYACRVAKRDFPEMAYLGWEYMPPDYCPNAVN